MGKREVLSFLVLLLMLTFQCTQPLSSIKVENVKGEENQGPSMDNLLIKYYSDPQSLYTGLLNGEIDIMDYPLAYDQFQDAVNNSDIITGFYEENSYISLDINNNFSISGLPWRSPTNYKQFRQAIACLVNKDRIVDEFSHGLATRVDTPIPRPLQNDWVNFNMSQYGPDNEYLGNYPWEYAPYRAEELLEAGDFVQGSTPNPYYDSTIPWSAQYVRVYPPHHSKAFQDLDPLLIYVRTDDPVLFKIGTDIVDHLRKIGIPVDERDVDFSILYDRVFYDRNYHIFTSEWILENPIPLHLFELYYSSLIGEYGSNVIQYQDAELDDLLKAFVRAADGVSTKQIVDEIQKIIVKRVPNIPIATRKGVYAYRKEIVNLVNQEGKGVCNKLAVFHSKNVNYPAVTELKVGQAPPPMDQNIFRKIGRFAIQAWRRIKNIFSKGIGWAAKNLRIPPWKLSIEIFKKTTTTKICDGMKVTITEEQITKITVKVGNSTKFWHDGEPITAYDLEFSLNYIDNLGPSSNCSMWLWCEIFEFINCTVIDDYTATLYFNTTSVWLPFILGNLEIIPKHIFETIDPNEAWFGYYPAGRPPEEVLIGSGPWEFQWEEHGGYMLLTANRNYYRSPIPGEIDFKYDWDNGYYQIDIFDLILLAVAYGSSGINEPDLYWDPSCDIAQYSPGIIDIYDLVTLATHYGETHS